MSNFSSINSTSSPSTRETTPEVTLSNNPPVAGEFNGTPISSIPPRMRQRIMQNIPGTREFNSQLVEGVTPFSRQQGVSNSNAISRPSSPNSVTDFPV